MGRKRTLSMKPSAILARAARIVEERGITRNQYIDHDTGEVCPMGAICLACGASELYAGEGAVPDGRRHVKLTAYEFAHSAAQLYPATSDDDLCETVDKFNDWFAEDEDDVVALLRDAAYMAKQVGE